MRIAKIQNKYFFESDKPNGTHTYAVYYDKATQRNRAVPLTHLYVKDKKRFSQVKKGKIQIEKFKEFDDPSGVWNYYYSQNIKGEKISLKHPDIKKVENRYLSTKQSGRIKKFAVYDYRESYKKRETRK